MLIYAQRLVDMYNYLGSIDILITESQKEVRHNLFRPGIREVAKDIIIHGGDDRRKEVKETNPVQLAFHSDDYR